MTSDEVIEIINEVCDKLGIGSNGFVELVPQIAKANIAGDIYKTIMGIVIIALAVAAIVKTYNRANELKGDTFSDVMDMTDYGPFRIAGICGGVVISFSVIMIILSMNDAIKWIVAPKFSVIEYVLSVMK